GARALDRPGSRGPDHARERARERRLPPRRPAARPARGLEPSNPRLILASRRGVGCAVKPGEEDHMNPGLWQQTIATSLPHSLDGGAFALGRATRATKAVAAAGDPANAATVAPPPIAARTGGQAPPSFAPLAAAASPAVVHVKVVSVVKAAEGDAPF